jgi:glycerophosphoryl diester phosphodiesterase
MIIQLEQEECCKQLHSLIQENGLANYIVITSSKPEVL